MAHFYGSVQGSRGQAHRAGGRASGLNVTAASWEGAVQVRLFFNEETNSDWCVVSLGRWHGRGSERVLYRGPVDGAPAGDTTDA